MLARVAESLYWIGRNIERVEHCTRYLKVQYFSTLEAPMLQNKDFTFRSILFMSGADFEPQNMLPENEVWRKVIFDAGNPNSIFSIVKYARENARSIRNAISTELWEAINKWYLFTRNYDFSQFDAGQIFSFSEAMASHSAVVKSNILNTLMHNDVWQFLNLGIFIERSMQIIRILRSKISDWIILSDNGVNIPLMTYQWTIMLKSLEAFDMHNNHFRGVRSQDTIFKMIIANELFPRSLSHSTNKILFHLSSISVVPENVETLTHWMEEIIASCKEFSDFDNEEAVVKYLDDTYESLINYHKELSNIFFY